MTVITLVRWENQPEPDAHPDDEPPTVAAHWVGGDRCPICGSPLHVVRESWSTISWRSDLSRELVCDVDAGVRIDDLEEATRWRVECENDHVLATSQDHGEDSETAVPLYMGAT